MLRNRSWHAGTDDDMQRSRSWQRKIWGWVSFKFSSTTTSIFSECALVVVSVLYRWLYIVIEEVECQRRRGALVRRNGSWHEGTEDDMWWNTSLQVGTETCMLRNRSWHVGTGADMLRNRWWHVKERTMTCWIRFLYVKERIMACYWVDDEM